MSRNSNVLFALLGVAIGATIGILLAPDKGTATRKKMTDAARKAADKMKESMKSASENDFDIDNPVA